MKKSGFAAAAAGIILFVFLFVFSEDFIKGLNIGLLNCVRIVIPSLFPFLIASSLVGVGELPARIKRLVDPITEFLFHLPAECLPAIILGQLGGYLSGAKAAESLYSSGAISRSQAGRLLLFCVNSGIGFSVNAVGNAMLGSREAGKVLLVSLCISSAILGALSRFFSEGEQESKVLCKNNPTLSGAVVNSVASSSSAMLNACAFVALFSGFGCVADSYIKSECIRLVLSCLMEVTKGCIDLSGRVSLPVIAAVCAFGGVCIHLQIFSLSQGIERKPLRFYAFRLLHAALSYVICLLILYFHPIEKQVFLSVYENAAVFSFSAPAAVSLLFLSVLLILDLDNSRKIC